MKSKINEKIMLNFESTTYIILVFQSIAFNTDIKNDSHF